MKLVPMQLLVRRGAAVAASLSLLSWFALYLEIFRWRHVTLSRIASVVWPDVSAASQPGGFVRGVVVMSALAPVGLLVFAAMNWRFRSPLERVSSAPTGTVIGGAGALAAFGIVLGMLGGINQAVRHSPFVVDLTLQRGNGGFVVLGVMLAVTGGLLRAWKQHGLDLRANR